MEGEAIIEIGIPRRRMRKPQSDGFDYHTYINMELSKLRKITPLSAEQERIEATRIRNKIAAQRSRSRQRARIVVASSENEELQNEIDLLQLEKTKLESLINDSETPLGCSSRNCPETILEQENYILREKIKQKTELEKNLKCRVAELETRCAEAYRMKNSGISRTSVGPFSTFRSFIFLLLLIVGSFALMKGPEKLQIISSQVRSPKTTVSMIKRSYKSPIMMQARMSVFSQVSQQTIRSAVS